MLKRALGVVLLSTVAVVLAGCGGGVRVTTTEAAQANRPIGLRLSAIPVGYRPWRSAGDVLDRWRRLPAFPASAAPGGRPTVHLWTVNRAYPAWVVTVRSPKITSVAVYDLRGRRWTMHYTVPPSPHAPPCQGGLCGFPINQGALDMAAGYAERVAGAAHVFTSDRVDDLSDHVIVRLVHAPHSVIAALNAKYPATYIIQNDGLRTLSTVTALQHSLDFSALHSRGVAIVSSWPSDKGRLIVGVTKNIRKAQAYFDATYGRGVVHVVHREPAQGW